MPVPVPMLPEMIAVPGGALDLRDARSGSARAVQLVGFELARTPVMGAQYGRGRADAPAHPITWFEAVRWCNEASVAAGLEPAYVVDGRSVHWRVSADGYRLPTEAEWEWACRAGTAGPAYGPLAAIAWSAADAVDGPQPVAGKRPNDFGLFDLLGNVWEWCWDYADTARYGEYRSLRGGGWADREWSLRASVRRGSAPDAVLEDVGFRVARGAVGEPGADAARGWSAQGWSPAADRARADVRGPLPMGWTPLR